MPIPTAERALREVFCRLKKIRKADGFLTDAGLKVFRARRRIDISDCPAVVIWDQGEVITGGSGASNNYQVVMTVTVDGHAACDTDDTGHAIECLKADVKRALLCTPNGGLQDDEGKFAVIAITGAQVSPREEGAKTESMGVNFAITFTEGYGNPFGRGLPSTE